MRQQVKCPVWCKTVGYARLAVLLVPGSSLAGGEVWLRPSDFKIPLWNHSMEARGGVGYKDNVLLSHTHSQCSVFWRSDVEVLLFRLPMRGWQLTFFADASDVRYFDSPAVKDEQVAIAAAQLSKDFGPGGKSTVGLNYLFQNQVFDFSEAYTNESSVGQIMGHTLTPRWTWRKGVGEFWVEGEMSGTRQWLQEPLDNFWQYGPRASVGRDWGRGSVLALSYQYSRLDYDTREQVDSVGSTLSNTALALNSHLAELSLTHVWDSRRHWQTVTGLGYEASLDNGSGFFDADYYRFSQQVRFRDEHWEITAWTRLSWITYSIQTVSATDTAFRQKTMLNVALRAERRLTKHLKAYASFAWDRSFSNLDFDDYEASTLLAGLAFTL